jgi:hypothetical protein
MNPATVQKLKEKVPELKELIAFLQAERYKLNDMNFLAQFEQLTSDQISLLVWSRFHAGTIIDNMLEPLLGGVDKPIGVNPEEYVL